MLSAQAPARGASRGPSPRPRALSWKNLSSWLGLATWPGELPALPICKTGTKNALSRHLLPTGIAKHRLLGKRFGKVG